MGIIIIAISIALSLFWIPGIWLSVRTTAGSDEPKKAFLLLSTLVAVEAFLAMILPFILQRNETIYHLGLLLDLGTNLGILSIVVGGFLWIYSAVRNKPVYSIGAASLFLTTAFVPVFYFAFSNKLATFFDIKWSY